METEKIVLLSGLCAALVVVTYILFGPPVQPARKKGRVGGLVNVGESCFLNSLLQALGSMPVFVEWLAAHRTRGGGLIHALHTDLSVVNGVHPCVWEDPYLPANVIRTLHRGWDIPGGEQDVHELFNVIMTTLDEEVKRAAAQHLSLRDALDRDEEDPAAGDGSLNNNRVVGDGHQQHHQADEVSQVSSELLVPPRLRHSSKSEYAAVNRPPEGDLRLIRSEASKLTRNNNNNGAIPSIAVVEVRPVGDWAETRRLSVTVTAPPRRHHRRHRASASGSPPPCEGLLTTQTHCVNCHYKSPVKYDSFKYVPLLLPSEGRLRLTLYGLLDRFTSTEVVADVRCEGCNSNPDTVVLSDALKVSNFGKLPKCLAFHIQRTVWTEEGPFKRFDFVEFPEILSMGSYTYSEIQRRKLVKRSSIHVDKGGVNNRSKNIYLLQAVIKHEGTADKGHFVTYRRSPVRPRRWYHTSDCDVHETDLERVLEAPAYMLFYTRCC